ncbi:hypothetical protein MAMT_02180 [Methylacidimicrobium tartarophylax]|uniref:Uncharacterized protein n=1 Tax=Methylacidimicrobium tartarophylax TaxID=1041768 RepID=A0A5E6MQ46_9BACT|nr:hypothetical protein MAMT_02180 [Methylacidimicrobium tartarophylax]
MEQHASATPEPCFDSSDSLTVEVRPKAVREAISILRNRQETITHAWTLAHRLDGLEEIAEEEAPDQTPIDIDSLLGFLLFLEETAKRHLNCPEIVLTPTGQIRAEWGDVSSRFFAVRFIGLEDAQFVLIAPDPANPRKTVRASTSCALESVMRLAEPYRVNEWIQDPDGR